MKKIILPLLVTLMLTSQRGLAIPHVSANLTFAAKLTGDQETPPVTTSAYGVASFILNGTRDTLCISVTVRDLSSAITAAHIHAGSYGLSGPPVVDLLPYVNGNRIFATLSGASLTPSMVSDLIARRFYINVHTTNNPNGEIRGQIELETDYEFKAFLDGSQIVPADSSPAIGIATFTLHHDYMYTDIRMQVTGLSGPITTAQLHYGLPGTNGPEVAYLDSFINGNTIVAEIPDQLFIYDMLAGNIYININTAANPIGEVRGQILLQSDLAFDVWMNGSQETPPTPSASHGAGVITFSESLDSLYYDVVFDTLTAPPTAAHFHLGSMGIPGPPIVDVTTSVNGNHLSGMATGLPQNFIANCLLGNIYLNVHSSQFPSGEIRGQVRRNAYEGFTYAIDGMKETPPSASIATGSGFVTIDPEQRSAHYRMVVNDLSGPLNGVHFHQGTSGVSGNIIFDLTPYFSASATNVSASNYWTDVDVAVPFDSSYAAMFLNNDTYVNFHTALFPDGEVRGDIIQGADCFVITGLANNLIAGGTSIYPMPVADHAVISFTAYQESGGSLRIYDVSGRMIFENPVDVLEGENNINLETSALSSGVYFVRLVTAEGETAFINKLIKQ